MRLLFIIITSLLPVNVILSPATILEWVQVKDKAQKVQETFWSPVKQSCSVSEFHILFFIVYSLQIATEHGS